MNQTHNPVLSKGSQKIVAKLRKDGRGKSGKGWGGVALPPPPTTPPPNPGNAIGGENPSYSLSRMKAGERLHGTACTHCIYSGCVQCCFQRA
jgi:hypothetical protein